MSSIVLQPIGVIHTPYSSVKGVPIQPVGARGVSGVVEVAPLYEGCLRDLEEFSHVILLYHFHLAGAWTPEVTPFMDDRPHGLFATRAPSRPNAIGISVVRLVRVEGLNLHVEDVDVVDGTPLLDIKPYLPEFDCREVERRGWLEGHAGKAGQLRSDGRFGVDGTKP